MRRFNESRTTMPQYETNYDIESKAYAALFHTAWHLLDSAKARDEGSLLNLQAASVFCAFAFEAYLNHVGSEEMKFWEEIDRISYNDKLSVLSKHLGLNLDKSRRPFQTIKELFGLRNALAHGRTQRIKPMVVTNDLPPPDAAWRHLPWEKLTAEDVQRYYDDAQAAVEEINRSRANPDDFLWNQGSRGFSRQVVDRKEQ